MTNEQKIARILHCNDCEFWRGKECKRECFMHPCEEHFNLMMLADWKDEQFYRVLAIIKVSLEKQGIKFNESFIKDCVTEYFKE